MNTQFKPSKGQEPNIFTAPSAKGIEHEHWSGLDAMQSVLGEMLRSIGSELATAIRLLVQANIDTTELRVLVNGVQKDLESSFAKLLSIRERHAGKSGAIKNVDDYSLYLALGLDYNQLNQNIQVQLWTPLTAITEYVSQARNKLAAADPNTITDVQVKDTQPA